jgi:putative CocE/NonD family hydrolase
MMDGEKTDIRVCVQMLPASDGTPLYTETVLPRAEGRFPTVLRRTPYRGRPEAPSPADYANDEFVRAGYAVVIQHVRGRNGSGGECIPYRDEGSDSMDLIRHVRAMPHYNGELFLSGTSYTASVWLCAMGGDLYDVRAAAFNVQTDRMYYRNYFNGCVRSFCGAEWVFSMVKEQHGRIAGDEAYVRPYSEIPLRALGTRIPYLSDALTHDADDGFWRGISSQNAAEKMSFPVLFVDGWFDFYTYGMCSMWERLDPEIRKKSCFIMGPYSHSTAPDPNSIYPLPGAGYPGNRTLLWFEHIRKGEPFPCGRVGCFNYYSLGAGEWRISDPGAGLSPAPGRAAADRLYLTPSGTLGRRRPAAGRLSYTYDPEDPPEGFRCDRIYEGPAPGSEPGVLSFVSRPFAEDRDYFGPVSVSLDVASDCPDTAFYAKFYLVEDGRAYGIAECTASLSWALGGAAYEPGSTARVRMKTHLMAFRVKKGCAVRVDIASSGAPFVPHPNVAGKWSEAASSAVANNTVITGNSCITLFREPAGRPEAE